MLPRHPLRAHACGSTSPLRGALPLASVILCVSCGGEDGGRPAAAQVRTLAPLPSDPCAADDGYEFELIEDFEDAHAQRFWVSSDKTESEMEPADGTNSPSVPALDEERCGESRFALRIYARGLSKYGGAFGMSYDYNTPFDASEWDGISLWVRRGPASGTSLFVGVNEQHTDEQGSAAVSPTAEPFCLNDAPAERNKCDRFGAGVALDEEWRFVAIRFDQMAQRGYGVVAPYLDVAAIQGLNCGFEVGDWEFWVDDLAYFREPDEE